MVVNRVDAEIICKKENMDLVRQYRKKFGVQFPAFNYVDFPGTKDKLPAEEYVELLKKAVQADKPLEFESHRYDVIDH